MIPLLLKLKKNVHREIAKTQDILVEELYRVFDNAVLHGGTAIWRCYKGNRFSDVVDVYIPRHKEKLNIFFNNLERTGFIIEKKKFTVNSLYSTLQFNRVQIRFEGLFKKIGGILKEYETADGNFITIYTLSAEELIIEKVSAYTKRLKIRDLYDIFFLLRFVKEREKVIDALQRLTQNFKLPCDENELKISIIEGLVPSSEKMHDYIKGWLK